MLNITYSAIIGNRTRIPEANLQAEFYRLCRQADIKVLLEVTYEQCRFDALVFYNDHPAVIIEVKNYGVKYIAKGIKNGKGVFEQKSTRQFLKYKQHGLPVLVIPGPDHIVPVFNRVKAILSQLNPA